jgi:hypothetical protein
MCVFDASWPGDRPGWIPLVTGQRRLAWQHQLEENRAAERVAKKKFRDWRGRIYEQSLTAIRLLDLSYLPMVKHPYREGEFAFDLELPLRDRNGSQTFCAHVSSVEELEEAIQHWFAALTYPTRAREHPEEYARMHPEGEEAERVRVADQYVKKIFHEDLPVEQRDALIVAIFRCNWFDIAPRNLRNYFLRVMRNAARRQYRSVPIALGGVPVKSLDEPLLGDPEATLMDTIEDPHSVTEDKEEIEEHWRDLWQFCGSIPPSQPKLQRMARLLLDLLDEEEAVQQYGRGGAAQLKRLRRELRTWRGSQGKEMR